MKENRGLPTQTLRSSVAEGSVGLKFAAVFRLHKTIKEDDERLRKEKNKPPEQERTYLNREKSKIPFGRCTQLTYTLCFLVLSFPSSFPLPISLNSLWFFS